MDADCVCKYIYFFSSLPSVIAKALGKAGSLPSAISIYTRQTLVFAECFPVKTLGKATVTVFAPSSYLFFCREPTQHSAKLCGVPEK